jgi:hypothetical protein
MINRIDGHRVVFGSNTYSATTGSAHSPILEYIHGLQAPVRDAILGGTISRILRLPFDGTSERIE